MTVPPVGQATRWQTSVRRPTVPARRRHGSVTRRGARHDGLLGRLADRVADPELKSLPTSGPSVSCRTHPDHDQPPELNDPLTPLGASFGISRAFPTTT